MPREISKMLTLSMAHVSPEACKLLEAGDYHHVVAYTYEYGWFVSVPEASCFSEEESLVACFKLARKHKCTWVQFDRDGPEEETLKTYDG